MTQRRFLLFAMTLAMAASAWAADVTGKWAGSMTLNSGGDQPAFVTLKQSGEVVTGSQGPSEDHQFPITSGRFDGRQVTIEARPGAATFKLSMKLDGNKLTGDVYEDDQKIGTVALQKVR
jgi:hypothetical protein